MAPLGSEAEPHGAEHDQAPHVYGAVQDPKAPKINRDHRESRSQVHNRRRLIKEHDEMAPSGVETEQHGSEYNRLNMSGRQITTPLPAGMYNILERGQQGKPLVKVTDEMAPSGVETEPHGSEYNRLNMSGRQITVPLPAGMYNILERGRQGKTLVKVTGEPAEAGVSDTATVDENYYASAASELYSTLKQIRRAKKEPQPLIALEGTSPLSPMSYRFWNWATTTFELAYRWMEARNQYVYETVSPDNPKRTRINTQHIAESLYGLHLQTPELFDQYIGTMEDPMVVACNGFNNNVLHAFLVFKNSRNSEYNTLHIRQGRYYPEFMDKDATIRYFQTENKHVLGAISLTPLAQAYNTVLDNGLMRRIFKERCLQKDIPYRFSNQNCMTFALLAFAATPFDLESFLHTVGLKNFQSPWHIIQALAGSERNHPALYTPQHSTDSALLPRWLEEINQGKNKRSN